MKRLVGCVLLLVVGCYEPPPTVRIGDLNVKSLSTGVVFADACLDAPDSSCGNTGTVVTLTNGNVSQDMPFTGFLFPQYSTRVDEPDVAAPFLFQVGDWTAEVTLPPPFTLTTTSTVVDADDQVRLRWDAAGLPMRWDWSYTHGSGSGLGWGTDVEDDGECEIEISEIADNLDDDACVLGCTISIQLSRVVEGAIDPKFPADGITGVQIRGVHLTFD